MQSGSKMSAPASQNSDWTVETINGRRYLNTGVALYEILSDAEFFDLQAQSTDDNGYPLTLFPYRNVETGTIIRPGSELEQGSLPCITAIVARIAAGLPWRPPRMSQANTVRHQLAVQRAQFDLKSGADRQTVLQNLEKQLAADADGADDGDGDDQADDTDLTWDQVRQKLGEQPAAIDAGCSVGGAGDDDNSASDSDGDEQPQSAAAGFHPSDYVQQKRTAASSPFEQASAHDDDDGGDKASLGNGFGANFGVMKNAPAGAPVLNIDCSAVNNGYMSALEPPVEPQHRVEAAQFRQMLAELDEIDPNDALSSGVEIDDDDDDDENSGQEQAEVDENGLPVLRPNNVLLDKRGRIAQRLDNALAGTAAQAESAQQRRETAPLRQRKTINEVLQAAQPRTVADELKDFNLPRELLDSLKQQPVVPTSGDAADAEFPKSIDDIAHLARPFKASNNQQQQQQQQQKERQEQKDQQKPTLSVQSIEKNNQVSTTRGAAEQRVTIQVSLRELVGLHKSVTTQLQSLAQLSAAVDQVLLDRWLSATSD